MEDKRMKILIIEDDIDDCQKFKEAIIKRDDIELVGITDSDIEALKLIKSKHPEGIVLDLELNKSSHGNTDAIDFMKNLKKMQLNFEPIVIVTTHVNYKRTYEILHRDGVELILYKDQVNYSAEFVLNKFLNYRNINSKVESISIQEIFENEKDKITNKINKELDLIGILSKLKGRKFLFDAISYLIEIGEEDKTYMQYLEAKYKIPPTTINNDMKTAISHAWRSTSIDDLMEHYTARVNHNTGIPSVSEFIYFYRDKIKKLI